MTKVKLLSLSDGHTKAVVLLLVLSLPHRHPLSLFLSFSTTVTVSLYLPLPSPRLLMLLPGSALQKKKESPVNTDSVLPLMTEQENTCQCSHSICWARKHIHSKTHDLHAS